MLSAILLLGALPFAAPSPAASASSFAGSTLTAVYPPPSATFSAFETFFPDAEQVGFAGPTPTGDEAEAIATAPAAPQKLDTYPLLNPLTEKTGETPSFNPLRYWGNLAPWYSVGDAFGLPDASPQLPKGCELTQVHLLHRHGARYPTSGEAPSEFAELLNKVATTTGFEASGPLEFLNTWTYKLGAELLTPFGRQQLYDLGVAFRVKYGDLLKGFTKLPVFRTTSEARMVDSALQFAAGFFGVQTYQQEYYELIIIEEDGFNNTLAPWNACPVSNGPLDNLGTEAALNWSTVYLKDTIPRLQKYIKGIELNNEDVVAMQELCAYETVALGYSAFCDLFTEEEWKGFEYGNDLDFWYSDGPGQPTTAAQGIGYVQELVARLTKTPLTSFETSLNSTLDGSNVTFPLDQPIYVDATHDTVISTVVTALNFTSLAANGPLPTDHIPKDQTYFVNQIAPFASNLVAQVMSCPASAVTNSKSTSKESYIRFLLNDGVVPLTGIAHCEEANKFGLCPTANFIQGMQQRIAEVDYNFDCFANYTLAMPDTLTNGRIIR
ncbi:phosphoglycerate mutase-like protein [Obba rivulosa]|uniref:Phosphoglycerate mutase-like protein n=1 Tax=Obba rivulosa TaxID=1052685 RepID=A0A8E2J749_9APHY|nr:phosphoglycerate mutase-like protein [Obba rivulosa]